MNKNEIVSTENDIQLFMITPIYKSKIKTVEVDGVKTNVEQQILVKELQIKKWIRKDAITSVENYVTAKNTISKTRAVIFDKYSNRFYVAAHNIDNIHEAISPQTKVVSIGFKNQQNEISISRQKSRISVNGNRREN